MADDRLVGKVITKFFFSTCRLRQHLNEDAVEAMSACAQLATIQCPHNDEADYIPLTTGSVAEFYIQPMFKCVGDVDVMFHRSDQLAIPAGTAPPTHLPDEFHSNAIVFEIIDSEFPGYVYLVESYILTECIDVGRYNTVQYRRGYYIAYNTTLAETTGKLHGPAVVHQLSFDLHPFSAHISGSEFSRDMVHCVHCLSWPSQAIDWPIRHREYGWPDSETVDCVVSNGCDVVFVAHRLCRQDN